MRTVSAHESTTGSSASNRVVNAASSHQREQNAPSHGYLGKSVTTVVGDWGRARGMKLKTGTIECAA
jgi:hypothetical protein